MNKSELIERLAKENGLSKAEAKMTVDLTFQIMAETLAQGDRIEVRGLGSFEVREYDEYRGRNPKTGKRIEVKPKKLPFFKVGRELKKRVDFE
jgi:integration host factor subunit beta